MKYIYSLIFVLSVSINAQDYEPKYEVDANKAEYYVGTFNDNKDVDDVHDDNNYDDNCDDDDVRMMMIDYGGDNALNRC